MGRPGCLRTAGIACAVSLLLLAPSGTRALTASKVFLRDPFPGDHAYRSKTDMLIAWHEADVRGATLVNIATRNGFFDPLGFEPAVDRLRALLDAKEYGQIRRLVTPLPFRESLLSPGNFVQAAYRLGIISEMVWVVPRGRSLTEEVFQEMKAFYSEKTGASRGKDFRFHDSVVTGRFDEMPVRICTLAELDDLDLDGTVIAVDMDYFTSRYKSALKKSLLSILAETVTALRSARIGADFAGVTESFYGGLAPLYHTYLKDALLPLIRRPALLEEELDPRWSAINEAFRLEALTDRAGAVETMRKLSASFPDYAYPLYFAAVTFFRQSREEQYRDFLARAFALDPFYLRGYVELSVWADRGGRSGEAKRLLEAALAHDEDDPIVLYLLGNRSMAEGNCREAAEYYRRFTAVAGEFRDILLLIEECPGDSPGR